MIDAVMTPKLPIRWELYKLPYSKCTISNQYIWLSTSYFFPYLQSEGFHRLRLHISHCSSAAEAHAFCIT